MDRNVVVKAMLNFMCVDPTKYEDVARTSDGLYLAMPHGHIGFDVFLGKPHQNAEAFAHSRNCWNIMDPKLKAAVFERMSNPPSGVPIPLDEFGIEEGKA